MRLNISLATSVIVGLANAQTGWVGAGVYRIQCLQQGTYMNLVNGGVQCLPYDATINQFWHIKHVNTPNPDSVYIGAYRDDRQLINIVASGQKVAVSNPGGAAGVPPPGNYRWTIYKGFFWPAPSVLFETQATGSFQYEVLDVDNTGGTPQKDVINFPHNNPDTPNQSFNIDLIWRDE